MDLSELQALRIQELAEMAKSLKISDDISLAGFVLVICRPTA